MLSAVTHLVLRPAFHGTRRDASLRSEGKRSLSTWRLVLVSVTRPDVWPEFAPALTAIGGRWLCGCAHSLCCIH